MSRHLSDIEIEAYRNRAVSPEQLLAFDDHVAECEQCSRLLADPQKVRRAYEALMSILDSSEPWEEHLSYEQLAGFVDGTSNADDSRFVLEHIQNCEECRDELREFRKLKEQIELDERIRSLPEKRHRLAGLWQMPGYRWAFGLALLVAALASVFWIYAHQMQLRLVEQRNAIAHLEQLNKSPDKGTAGVATGAVFLVQDGNRQVALNQNGDLVGLGGLPVELVRALKTAVMMGRLPVPTPPETSLGRVGELLGADERDKRFEVLSPTGTVVENTRPQFEWQRLAGAKEYLVMMRDLVTGAETESPATSDTTWTPGADLVRGHQYAWMVEAKVGSRRVRAPATDKAFATFRVLKEDQANEIEGVRKMYGDSHLAMGLAYAQAGLVPEAKREFSALLAANPDSAFAKNLLASVAGKQAGAGR